MLLWWQILIIIYIVTHFLGIIVMAWTQTELDITFLSPYALYKYCKVNIFGAIFLWALHLAFTPIYALIGLVIWLCTLGVK